MEVPLRKIEIQTETACHDLFLLLLVCMAITRYKLHFERVLWIFGGISPALVNEVFEYTRHYSALRASEARPGSKAGSSLYFWVELFTRFPLVPIKACGKQVKTSFTNFQPRGPRKFKTSLKLKKSKKSEKIKKC